MVDNNCFISFRAGEEYNTPIDDSEETHLGGCILISPVGEIPGDLYQETDIIPTDEYPPFTKKLSVYGITLIGRDDISDDFMRKVAKTIKEMFPQDGSIDAALQEEVLKNLYKYRAVIPFFKGVFGIHVLATADSSDEIVLHVANVLAKYLDNDEDEW